MYAIGLDIGTTSVCGILHDAANGEILATRTRKNDSFLPSAPWAKEQDPQRLLTLVHEILKELLSLGHPVLSIGVTGQMHGIVYLDKNGQPVSSLRIWQDGRGDLLYRDGKTYAAHMSALTGHPLATGYGAVTFFYDRKNGLVPDNAVTFCSIHDLVALSLVGGKTPLLHASDAAALGLYDPVSDAFDRKAMDRLGLPADFFPPVTDRPTVLGSYLGIPVAVAIGDNQASFLGAVSDPASDLLVNIGTGSQISCFVSEAPSCGLDRRPFLDGGVLLAGSALCGGRAYALLEGFFREIAEAVTGISVKSAYPAMDRLMASDAPLPSSLTVDPRFSGTRTDPSLRGSIAGIGIDNLTMRALCDGVLCGMANELHTMYTQMLPYLPSPKHGMIGSGNGIRCNEPLKRRLQESFGLPLRVPVHKEEAAFGASLFALTAAGVFPDLAAAGTLVRYE